MLPVGEGRKYDGHGPWWVYSRSWSILQWLLVSPMDSLNRSPKADRISCAVLPINSTASRTLYAIDARWTPTSLMLQH